MLWKFRKVQKRTPVEGNVKNNILNIRKRLPSNGKAFVRGACALAGITLVGYNIEKMKYKIYSCLFTCLNFSQDCSVFPKEETKVSWKNGKLFFKNIRISSNGSEGTLFDLNVSNLSLDLSFTGIYAGKGIVKSCSVEGVRGFVDYRNVPKQTGKLVQSKKGQRSKFHLEDVTVKDVLVEFLYPDFRPFPISILNGEFERLRLDYLLYDTITAKSLVGMYEDSLFSVHIPQVSVSSDACTTMRHLKIDNVNVDHFTYNANGHMNWIVKGFVDWDVLLKFPSNSAETIKFEKLKNILLQTSSNVQNEVRPLLSYSPEKEEHCINSTYKTFLQGDNSEISFKIDLRARNIKAIVPTDDLNMVSNALVRPLVSYFNESRATLDLSFCLSFKPDEFKGVLFVSDSVLPRAITASIYSELAKLLQDDSRKRKAMKKAALWGIHNIAKSTFSVFTYTSPSLSYS